MNTPPARIIVSVGGSLIVPDEISTTFLSDFRALILSAVAQGYSFFIIAGGGKTARAYQEAARSVRVDLSREDLDWIGIHATRLNAHLLRTIFREHAYERVIKNHTEQVDTQKPIIIGAGTKPGWSTDYCAVTAAKTLGARRLVNLSNTDYVYDHDPNTHPGAKPFTRILWNDFRALIPSEWSPGMSAPFDPIAARVAEALALEVAVINGNRLGEFSQYLEGKNFVGTTIS